MEVLSWFKGQMMEVSLCAVALSVESDGEETETAEVQPLAGRKRAAPALQLSSFGAAIREHR